MAKPDRRSDRKFLVIGGKDQAVRYLAERNLLEQECIIALFLDADLRALGATTVDLRTLRSPEVRAGEFLAEGVALGASGILIIATHAIEGPLTNPILGVVRCVETLVRERDLFLLDVLFIGGGTVRSLSFPIQERESSSFRASSSSRTLWPNGWSSWIQS